MHINRRKLSQFILGLAGTTLLGSSGAFGQADAARQTQGVTATEILIGAFGPMTGPSAWIGLSGRDGIMLALNEINANGGVNGRKLRVIFESAQSPADSVAAAKKLVEQDKVFVLIAASGSTGAAAAADYVRDMGIPTLNPFGTTPKIREPFGRNIFHGAFPDARIVAEYFADEIARTNPRPKTAGVIVGTYEFPQAVFAGLVPRLEKRNIAIKTKQQFDNGTQDFTAQLVVTAGARPDVVVFLGNAAEAGLAIKQGPELGLSGIPWVIDVAGISRSVPQVAGRAAEGIRSVWVYPYFHDEPDKPMADFDRKWRVAYGNPAAGRPSYVDVNAYGDFYMLALALRQAGKDLSWEKLITTWERMENVKPSDFGPFASDVIFPETWTPTERDGNKRYSTVQVINGVWRIKR